MWPREKSEPIKVSYVLVLFRLWWDGWMKADIKYEVNAILKTNHSFNLFQYGGGLLRLAWKNFCTATNPGKLKSVIFLIFVCTLLFKQLQIQFMKLLYGNRNSRKQLLSKIPLLVIAGKQRWCNYCYCNSRRNWSVKRHPVCVCLSRNGSGPAPTHY